jgi:hypothetical protein
MILDFLYFPKATLVVIDTKHFCAVPSGMTTTGFGAAGYATVATHLFFSMVKIMITMMLVVLLVARLHVHIFDATNMLLIYFWIKLIYIEFNKFSNNPKTYRYFLVAGFVNALKQNVFAIFLLNLD